MRFSNLYLKFFFKTKSRQTINHLIFLHYFTACFRFKLCHLFFLKYANGK